jgi:3-oxoadipate enol-lactonase/4-carboxymuconolactone decarboxylase
MGTSAETARDGTRYAIDGTTGPWVVLVHGLGLNRLMWQWQLPALAGRHRVLSYDLLGHGQSPPPPAPPSLSLWADQLERLLDELGLDRVALVGFSIGAMIARRFALDRAGRLWALALLNSPHRRDAAARQKVVERMELVRRAGPAATVAGALERWFTDGFRAAHPEVTGLVRDWIAANDPAVYAACYRVLVEGVDELSPPDPPTRCPVLVMTGAEDHGNPPEASRAIAAGIPGARLVVAPGLRHMGLVEAPAIYDAAVAALLDAAAPRPGGGQDGAEDPQARDL